MTDVVEKSLNRRQRAKARTQAKVVAAAQAVFEAKPYVAATIRDIAKAAGMSTGAIFANFKGKAELWVAAMGSAPPVDSGQDAPNPVLRTAHDLLAALKGLQAVRPSNWDDEEDGDCVAAWAAADAAVAQAEGRS
ncbi:MAG: hypothetical protein DCF29_08015 [Alphaproteobacteria bacterium]|nr:MAG: hypothetical protein DCF29_08015 [Alphaproteobacteria bacterium]